MGLRPGNPRQRHQVRSCPSSRSSCKADVVVTFDRGGQEPSGEPLYIARVHIQQDGQDWGIHVGKIGQTTGEAVVACAIFAKHCFITGRGALIPFGGKEQYYGKCEILVGDENSIRWVDRAGYPSFEGAYTRRLTLIRLTFRIRLQPRRRWTRQRRQPDCHHSGQLQRRCLRRKSLHKDECASFNESEIC